MTLVQFRALVARYGPAVDDWPQGERDAALNLLQASPAAQDLFAEACLADDDDDGGWDAPVVTGCSAPLTH